MGGVGDVHVHVANTFSRLGKVDLNCIANCPGLEDEVVRSYMAYLEGVWMRARAGKGGRSKVSEEIMRAT